MSRPDKIAIALSLLTVLAAAWISLRIFEGLPHLEDEFAYLWQARVIARGELTIPTPPQPKSFLVPFVVDYQGQRFGKYPLGWPALLSLGERLGLRWLVNPLLAGLSVWLIYRLGKKVLNETVGLLAAGLTATSPFFLMNSGVLLSHPWGLALSSAFALSWLDATEEHSPLPAWLPTLAGGLALGVLALSRPYTALGVALPFGVHGLFLLLRGSPAIKPRLLALGAIAMLVASLHFLWQYAVTGDPLRNTYTLWWEYDKIGFGPGFGVTSQGHSWDLAWQNTLFTLHAGYSDLFGWGKYSWLFLPFGLWFVRKERKAWLVISVFPVLVGLYMAYWIGAWLLGPRYYYEGLYSLTILSAAGIAGLAGWPLKPHQPWIRRRGWGKARPLGVTALVALLLAGNLLFYTPARIGNLQGLYGVHRAQLEPFLSPQVEELAPALIIVDSDNWRDYAVLLELADPLLDSPLIFTWSHGPRSDAAVMEAFPERKAFLYSPTTPGVLYSLQP